MLNPGLLPNQIDPNREGPTHDGPENKRRPWLRAASRKQAGTIRPRGP